MRRLLFLCSLLAVMPAAGAAPSAAGTPAPAVLQPGDAVRIAVWDHEALSGQFDIAADGRIAHPLYRAIYVSGMPLDSVEARVAALLRRFDTDPQFVVQPLFRVVVGGEVRQPSLYLLSPETTIAQAVGLAGGVTELARLDRVILFRGGVETRVDLSRAEPGAGQTPIRSGDQILVHRRVSIFREYIAPAGGVVAALATLISLIIN
jgi:polysaccharide export outer membrane protein